ncbi:ferric/cupric-chelate reductase [Rhizopus stolonifer]|uniref:Ferric/cupric-chelate reductase n=1 Tax=Rhizopus stolonifer TaxID=4846 RepID=A0A367K328_RHIST|nr:ferric/cupric-chelate reductase [Rhizopus stolonifer]
MHLPGSRLFHRLDYVIRIPYVTDMISLKQIAGILLFSLINLYFIFFVCPYEPAPYHLAILDRRAAFTGMVDLGLVFFFAQRNSLLPKICGLTFEELIPFHRIFARIGFLNFVPHLVYRVWDGYIKKYSIYDAFFFNKEYTTGTIATAAYIVMFATSLEYIRRHHFELFYYCHIVFLIPAIVFTCWHYPTCLAFYTPAVALWLADRVVRSYKSWIIKPSFVQVEQVTAQTATQEGIVRILFQSKLLNNFKPGQYIFAAIVINKHKFWEYLNWHPFTISKVFETHQQDVIHIEETATSLVNEITNLNESSKLLQHKISSVHIKSLGTKTQDLLNASVDNNKLSNDLKIYIDGLYGPQLPYQDYPILALFATGIGVTPALAIIQDIVKKRSKGVRTIVSDRIYLCWAIRVSDEIDPFMEMFTEWENQIKTAVLPIHLSVDIYITRMKRQSHPIGQYKGFKLKFGERPQVDTEMEKIKVENKHRYRVWAHVCGSTPFTRNVINAALRVNFHVHHETFEF